MLIFRKNILAARENEQLAAMRGQCFLQPGGFLLHLIQQACGFVHSAFDGGFFQVQQRFAECRWRRSLRPDPRRLWAAWRISSLRWFSTPAAMPRQ